jgi:hypothetical protein
MAEETKDSGAAPTRLAKATYRDAVNLQASADYLVRKSGAGWVAEDRASGTARQKIPNARGGKKLTDIVLDESWLVWMYGGTPEVAPSLYAAHLPNGDEFAIGRDVKAPEPGLPSGFVVDHGQLAYASQTAGPTNCVVVLDLTSRAVDDPMCTPTPEHGTGKAHATPFGTVFNQWSPSPEPQGCVSLHLRTAGRDSEAVPSQRPCGAWSGVMGDGFLVWSEPTGRDPDRARMYGKNADGQVADLGMGDTSTERLCGDAVYWNAPAGEIGEIHSWRPGEDVEVAYRMPESGALILGPLTCDAESLFFTQGADGPDRVVLLELPIG